MSGETEVAVGGARRCWLVGLGKLGPMQRRAMAAGSGGAYIGRGPEPLTATPSEQPPSCRTSSFLPGVPLRAATFKHGRRSPPHGIKSPLNSSSFNFGRLTMPRRLSTVPLVKDQMIFSSLGADPLANSILVIDEPSTIRRLSLGNSSLLNKISFSTQAFSFSTRQRIYCILANIFRSSLLSLVPQRVTLETFSALSNNESLLLLFNSTSFSSGRSSTPERDCMISVEHKMIFSSLRAAPSSNKMSVMLDPSTRKHLRFLNLSFLKVSLPLVYALSWSLRQTILGSSLRTLRSSCFSRVPVRVIFASWNSSLCLISS
ncbi:hypothetical protein CFC21_055000 [Triticum aestivum]|uniref:Uncharacterized protein n=2 Tax=Triticum aestivum TaxID=4565 RepID=A0A9R1K9K4_WHEAT|nr:hypothetical protein CFC21_055000 [Triticum aestivum]